MHHWRHTAKTIATTFLVTSAAWMIGGAILFVRMGADPPVRLVSKVSDRSAVPRLDATLAAPAGVGGMVIPVAGVRPDQLVDTFTQSREGGARAHNAIDIMAPRGTPVVAAQAGTVEKLFVSKRGGNTIYVRSPDRALIYYYAHLDSYAPGLSEGQSVYRGETLGTVGISGNVDPAGPHLHFEILRTTPEANWWQRAVQINPYPLLTGRR